MNLHWLFRAKRLAQNPPSWSRVKLFLLVLAICAAIVSFEFMFGWPEALTPNGVRRPRITP